MLVISTNLGNFGEIFRNLGTMFGQFRERMKENKPAALAAGTDPSRCNSANRQILPIHQNLVTFKPLM